MIPQALPKSMPRAPRLHWGVLLAIQIVTLGLFSIIWLIVVSSWVKRVNGKSQAYWWSIVNACMLPALFLLVIIETLVGVPPGGVAIEVITTMFRLGMLVTGLGSLFVLRSELESWPISIPLSGVATFFLGVIYFQYHLHDYDVEGRGGPEGSLGLTS